jgi:hypothetical protein
MEKRNFFQPYPFQPWIMEAGCNASFEKAEKE